MSQATLLPCKQCGFESPDNAKFCRSCGAALVPESEFSGAATRNYGRQEGVAAQPMSAPLPSRPLGPSVVDAFGEDTRPQPQAYAPPVAQPTSNTNPFYTPPPAPQMGYAPPAYQVTPEGYGNFRSYRRSEAKWAAVALGVALAFGSGMLIKRNNNNARLSPQELQMLKEYRQGETIRNKFTDSIDDIKSRSERNMNDLMRQFNSASEEARRAAERSNKLDVTGMPVLDLDKYEYGAASISSAIRIPGKEMRVQHVKEDFDTLLRHYETLMGKPIVLKKPEDDDEKQALFQTAGTAEDPSVSVRIKQSDEVNDMWEILVMRTPISFPRLLGRKILVEAPANLENKPSTSQPLAQPAEPPDTIKPAQPLKPAAKSAGQ